jgi:hypothetical protein
VVDRPMPVTLRVEPHAIVGVRKAFEEALTEIGKLLNRLQNEGYLHEPWLGDEISLEVRDYYNDRVMNSTDGPYAALVAYEAELLHVRETLKSMEDEYRRTEGDNAQLWGRA